MYEIFPEGRFIFLVRDGRAVFKSTAEIQMTAGSWRRIFQRVFETSVWELPAYLSRIDWAWRKLLGLKIKDWGMRPPGWEKWDAEYSESVVIAMRWAKSVDIALKDFNLLPESNRLMIHYEDLVKNPEAIGLEIAEFIDLPNPRQLVEALSNSARSELSTKWESEIPPNILNEIRPAMEPTLIRLGYRWKQ